MLYLKKLSLSDGKDIYGMLQEIDCNDNGFHNKVCGMTYEEYEQWLENEFAVDCGRLLDWMVPQSSYWLYEDDIPVGYGRIRHYLNENLEKTSGHIGYAIAKSKRGKGYGNEILSLLISECENLGIYKIQIGANADNVLSNKVIIKNGGRLIRTENGKNFYKIEIAFNR